MRKILGCLVIGVLGTAVQAETRITDVTLSTSGLAMIGAAAQMGPDGLMISVRRNDIEDFLKSLRLSDPEGGVPRLTMAGPHALSDIFADLPFGPNDVTNLRALIDAMPGATVQVERRGMVHEGQLMGSMTASCATDSQRGCVALGLRLPDGTLRQIALDDATSLRFVADADNNALDTALAALHNAATEQSVQVTLTSSALDPREIALGWLQPAPLWQTAWRAEIGEEGVTLTGWAVLENATGHDWQDVELTLATGAVQALEVQLYDRLDAPRKLAAPAFEPAFMAEAGLARSTAFEDAFDLAAPDMDDGISFSRFTLPQPITLAAGQMISLPFLRDTVADGRLTLYRGGQGYGHPVHALAFTNPLPLRLPAGVATIYDAGRGHAGDALIPELAPKAETLVEYARETALRVREDAAQAQTVLRARVVDGLLVAQTRLEHRTVYQIEGAADAPRLLTLDHPHRAGWQMATEGGEARLDVTRFTIALEQGQIKSFPVMETRITETRIGLLDLDDTMLGYWVGQSMDDASRSLLSQLQELRSNLARTRADIARLSAQEAELIADQDRLAGLITQLGDDSPQTANRRARVDAIDAQIEDLRAARDTATDRLNAMEEDLRGLLSSTTP